MARQINV